MCNHAFQAAERFASLRLSEISQVGNRGCGGTDNFTQGSAFLCKVDSHFVTVCFFLQSSLGRIITPVEIAVVGVR